MTSSNSQLPNIRLIIFDLDDTLLDTSRQLIEPAIHEACRQMIEDGLDATLPICVQTYHEFSQMNLRRDFFTYAVAKLGLQFPDLDGPLIAERGRRRFLQPRLPDHLDPMEGALFTLSELQKSHPLALVTSGEIATQKEKVEKLKIESYFAKIAYVGPGQSKTEAFRQLQDSLQIPSNQILCVGNRLDSEIQAGRSLGFQTCWLSYGEHRQQKPLTELEAPHYTIDKLSDIVALCRT